MIVSKEPAASNTMNGLIIFAPADSILEPVISFTSWRMLAAAENLASNAFAASLPM
jgi:hypothetical protein